MMRHSRLICRRHAGPAFSLAEMLLVLAVLGTLLALVMPLFGHAVEISRSAKCKSNLHSLAALLHTEEDQALGLPGGSVHTIPTANRWMDFVVDHKCHKLLLCPSEEIKRDLGRGLKNLWVRQDGHAHSQNPDVHYSNLYDLLNGIPVDDWQVGALYQGAQYGMSYEGWQWVENLNGAPPEDNQAFVTIATCAAFLVTINETTIDLTPLGHHPNWNTGSNHWITKGDPNEDTWQRDVLVELTGQGQPIAHPSVRVYVHECHYGMSNLVPVRNYLHSQLWLTEYSSDVMRLSNYHRDDPFDGDLENGEVLGRHFGFANCADVDGSVFRMSKNELKVEFEKIDTGTENVFQY